MFMGSISHFEGMCDCLKEQSLWGNVKKGIPNITPWTRWKGSQWPSGVTQTQARIPP